MENKKFCFIICTDKPVFLEECVHYLQHLAVPKGYDMDLLTVKDAVSMASGYQEAMEQSDAKYKIYMHQDVFILNRNFLTDLLVVFEDDPEIGMIGMVGYEKMSGDGIMWHQKRIGDCADLSGGYAYAAVVDGFLLATQYDFPWNQAELTGFDFYDAFQCMEFLRAGYKIAVPAQNPPWCLHDDGRLSNMRNYDKYRQLFLKKYGDALGKDYRQILRGIS
ncbi:MAG: glycosyltransferase family protein [Lachnospiraceae bacterium]|nr:glycosyltransferase family protein [Lachnospiraceae bacterium]